MITEDYCSYEVAKLLKEKGFDIECKTAYYNGRLIDRTLYGFCDGELLDCPSQSLAMKWLREVHEWSIQVFPVFEPRQWCYDVYKIGIKFNDQEEHLSSVDYDKYEETVEAALKYCLTNLI